MDNGAMQNAVFLNSNGYVEIQVNGDQTAETFRQIYDTALPIVAELTEQKKPLIGLIDLTRKGHYTPGSNKAAMELLGKINYDRVAIVGAEAILAEVTELIVLAMGKSENTQLFHDREQALSWLRGEWPKLV